MNEEIVEKKRILIVEDEPVVGRLCQRLLAAEGYEADLVNNGLRARDAAADKAYLLCVSDIRLPGMTGLELYEHWKAGASSLADRLIFITGDTLNNTVQAFLESSGLTCLLKPFNPEDLSEAVKKLLPPEAAISK